MRNFLIACAVFFGCSLYAQQYVPFPTDSAHWNCSFWAYQWTCQSIPAHDYEYTFCGDTLIGATVYHKICAIGWTADGNCYTPPSGYQGCIREDSNKRVFFRPAWLGFDTLLYDFNLQVGDTLKSYQNTCQDVITAIDSILIGSTYRKQYHIGVSFSCGNFNVAIIEGIGSTGGLIEPFGQYMAHNTLDCFSHHNQTLYPDSTIVCAPLVEGINPEPDRTVWNAFPNPASDNFSVTSGELQHGGVYTVALWNLSGQQVSSRRSAAQNNSLAVDRNGLAEGTYFVEIISGQETIARIKVIFL